MIIETHKAAMDERYLTGIGLCPEDCIYFDIETTGLKAETSHLYLIGYAVRRKSGWEIVQLFAEKTSEEEEVLSEFSDICGRYRTVIHFNGDRFDIPYLEKKYQGHGMASPFSGLNTVDIYRRIRPYKSVLSLERLNQKTVEKFLGIRRKDQYDGGQLIDVYRFYRDDLSPDREGSLRKLMLHNYEDVLGMFSLTKLLAYPLAVETGAAGGCQVSARLCKSPVSMEGEARPDRIELMFGLPVPVPVPVTEDKDTYQVNMSGCSCQLDIRVRETELRHYFPDYRDYYYLPEEDRAIHKSVAQFVDKDHRVKAKADTCYVKKQGKFLPVPADAVFDERKYPVFREARKDRQGFIELTDELEKVLCGKEEGDMTAGAYLRMLLSAGERSGSGSR